MTIKLFKIGGAGLVLFLAAWLTLAAGQARASSITEINLGLPGGDCFGAYALAADPDAERLFVLCDSLDWDEADTLMVWGSAADRPLATLVLDETLFPAYMYAFGQVGQLHFDAAARRLYVAAGDYHGLLVLDADTLIKIGWLSGRRVEAVAAGPDYIYMVSSGLRVYRATDLTLAAYIPPEELPAGANRLAFDPANNRLYLGGSAAGVELQTRQGETLALETTLTLTGTRLYDLAANPSRNELYALTDVELAAFDGQTYQQKTQNLAQWAISEQPFIKLALDPAAGRLHLLAATGWLSVDSQTLQAQQHQALTNSCGAYQLLAAAVGGNGRLLYLFRDDNNLIHRTHLATGRLEPPLRLNRRLLKAVLDPQRQRFYFVDSSGAVQFLQGPTLQPVSQRPGLVEFCQHDVASLALATGPERLFVADGRANRTLALAADTLNPLGQIDQTGLIAADGLGERLFIARYALDDSQAGDLYSFDAATLTAIRPISVSTGISGPGVGPYSNISDLTFADNLNRLFMHIFSASGTSGGSCGGCSWKSYAIYDPDSLTQLDSLEVGQESGRWETVAFSPDGRRIYATFQNPTSNSSGQVEFRRLVIFDQDYQVLRQIPGLLGPLATDGDYVYMVHEGYLLALAVEALEQLNQPYLKAMLPLDQPYDHLALAETGQLYLWSEHHLATIAAADLLAQPASPLIEEVSQTAPTSPTLATVGHFGGAAGPLAHQDDYLYANLGREIAVFDISDRRQPRRLGYTILSAGAGPATDMAVAGDTLYVATERAGLRLVDISDPASPLEVGSYAPALPWRAGQTSQVVVAGAYAYLLTPDRGLRVLDVSDAARPVEAGFYELPNVRDFAVQPPWAYLATTEGVHILDVTDPATPVETAFYKSAQVTTHLAMIGPAQFYLLRNLTIEEFVDLSNPANPTGTTLNYAITDQYDMTIGMALAGSRLYVSTSKDIHILDISNPETPTKIGLVEAVGGDDLVADQAYLYASYSYTGLTIVDLAQPAAPLRLDLTVSVEKMVVAGDRAYLVGQEALLILDISNPANPTLLHRYEFELSLSRLRDVTLVGRYLYLLAANRFSILDLSDPTQPVELNSYNIGDGVERVFVLDHYAYLVQNCCPQGGLWLLDVSRPEQPLEIGFFEMPVFNTRRFLWDRQLHLYTGSAAQVIDLSDPLNPSLIEPSLWSDLPMTEFFAIEDHFAYHLQPDLPNGMLRVFDISNPVEPVVRAGYQAPELFWNTTVSDGTIYLANSRDGFSILRRSE